MNFDPLALAMLPLSAYTPGQGDKSMEGGWETASGAPVYPLEWHLRDPASYPYVTGATSNKDMMGQTVFRRIGDNVVPVKITDYGPGVKGIDIASVNKDWAKNFPYQGSRDYFALDKASYADQSRPLPIDLGVLGQFAVRNYGGTGGGGLPSAAGGTGQMSTWQDYGKALLSQSKANAAGSAVSSAFSGLGQSIAQQGQSGMQQAMEMISRRRNPFESYLQSLLNPGGFI